MGFFTWFNPHQRPGTLRISRLIQEALGCSGRAEGQFEYCNDRRCGGNLSGWWEPWWEPCETIGEIHGNTCGEHTEFICWRYLPIYAIMRTMCGIFTMIYLQNWVISDVRANVGIHIPAPCFANMGNYLGHQFIEGTFFQGWNGLGITSPKKSAQFSMALRFSDPPLWWPFGIDLRRLVPFLSCEKM